MKSTLVWALVSKSMHEDSACSLWLFAAFGEAPIAAMNHSCVWFALDQQ